MIVRDIYALSSNGTTKIADWVAYRLDRETVLGNMDTTRNWKTDPCLEDKERLEPDDYKHAYEKLEVDRAKGSMKDRVAIPRHNETGELVAYAGLLCLIPARLPPA